MRRKWDKDEYAAKAAERKTAEARPSQAALTLWRVACAHAARLRSVCPAQEAAAEEERRAKVSNSLGLVVRKPLSVEGRIERDYVADLRARVGTKQLVNPDTQEGAGFFCKESGKLVRDSISYLDHINGKKRASPSLPRKAGLARAETLAAQRCARWACLCAWSAARWRRCRRGSKRRSGSGRKRRLRSQVRWERGPPAWAPRAAA